MKKRQRKTVAVLMAAVTCLGQEFDPNGPTNIAYGVEHADLVVAGTFRATWFFPWFDGWHYTGLMTVDEVLMGNRSASEPILFHWVETFGSYCLIFERLSQLYRLSAIWLLNATDGTYTLTWTPATWCGFPLSFETRPLVMNAIRQRNMKPSNGVRH